MMIDWGMGLARQTDVIDSAGIYIDVVKIAATIPRIMPRELLVRNVGAYRDRGIPACTGGSFTELAYKQGTVGELLEEAKSVGFAAVSRHGSLT